MAKFLGITYARAERFRIAEPVAFKEHPTEGQSHGAPHFQMQFGPNAAILPGGSDDCLHLDIWTPTQAQGGKPVLIWLYGGGFEGGSTAGFDAQLLSDEQDVVVVVVNYRVGMLGFGYLPGQLPSNLGLRDVICAIEWVQNYVDKFGGDRSNITLIGESAGGFLATAATASKSLNASDFKLIAMSGAASRLVLVEDIETMTSNWLTKLGVKTIDQTKTLPIKEMLSAQREIIPRDFGLRNGARVNALGVVLDSELSDGVLLDHPFKVLSKSISKVFLTTVQREMASMRRYTADTFAPSSKQEFIDEIISFAQSIKRGIDIANMYLNRFADLGDAREQVLSDFIYRLPAARLAKVRTMQTWHVDFEPEVAAGHGSDVFLLFPKTDQQKALGANFRAQVGGFAHSGVVPDEPRADLDWELAVWQGVERI